MSTHLAEAPQQSLFDIPGCHFSEVGLDIEPGMKFDHWERLLRCLARAEQGIQWYIGDALNYGEREYGERYAQVLDAHDKTGIPIDRLRQYQWVAEHVKPVTRVTTLDWSTHREVASLPEDKQREILQRGAREVEAGRKYTRRQAEKESDRVKRAGKPKPSDEELVLPPEARTFLDHYMEELAKLAEEAPEGCLSVQMLITGQGHKAYWQKNRTRQADYAAITQVFSFEEGTPGLERAKRDEISAWLETCGYFMSDPELDERLDAMVEGKMLQVKSIEDSRQEGRRGTMVELYALHPEYEARLEGEK